MSKHYGILHNRKAAGTALKAVIEQQKQHDPSFNVTCFGHAMTFPLFIKTHPDSEAIFFIRDPISRFVSGFYSRLRQGKPRYNHPWKKSEAKAFARFQTPNQLAEALSDKSFFKRWAARHAMKSIGHVKHTYLDFFGPIAFLEKHTQRIAFIGYQPEFDADLVKLRELLNISNNLQGPDDEIKAHRNPKDVDTFLSNTAISNLKKWYRIDFEIYEWCLTKRKAQLNKKCDQMSPILP